MVKHTYVQLAYLSLCVYVFAGAAHLEPNWMIGFVVVIVMLVVVVVIVVSYATYKHLCCAQNNVSVK